MTDQSDNRFWEAMVPEMQEAMHLRPYTSAEAEWEFDEAPAVPLSEDDVNRYAEIALSGIPREPSYAERTASSDSDSPIDAEVQELQGMFRNQGELDPEVEEEMRRKREESQDHDDPEENDEPTSEA